MNKALAAATVVAALSAGTLTHARDLTFDERVAAQEAIARVYYAHQVGATVPFETAVPRAVLEAQVRATLLASAALETVWNTPVTAAMLEGETRRMAAATRLPDRLDEMSAALHRDGFVFQETIARASLADRLARSFFASDNVLHAGSRQAIEALRAGILAGRKDPRTAEAARSILEIVLDDGDATAGQPSEKPSPSRLGKAEYARARAALPSSIGSPGPVRDAGDAFTFDVLLEEGARRLLVARYAVVKTGYDAWLRDNARLLGQRAVPAVAPVHAALPKPRRDTTPWEPPATAEALPAPASGGVCAEDTWNGSLDGLPDGRERATAVWTGNVMIVWGGALFTDLVRFNTGGRYDPATDTWTMTSMIGAPTARKLHTAIWTGSEMVVWGGVSESTASNTGGRYNPVTDTWRPTATAAAPAPRSFHTAVWTGTKMLIWGGLGASNLRLASGGAYDPAADTWSSTPEVGAPAARIDHTAVWTGSEMLVWGGGYWEYAGSNSYIYTYLNTGAAYSPATDSWRTMSVAGAPAGRWGHAAVYTGTRMLIWGGYGATGGAPGNGGGVYDPGRDAWTPMSATNAPAVGYQSAVVWAGTVMVVWGGSADANTGNTAIGARYDPRHDRWTAMSTANAPEARSLHVATWTGALVLVWGGSFSGYALNTGGRYDPSTDSWTPTSLSRAPSARSQHTSVWTGNQMIVWGGMAPQTHYAAYPVATGARYDPAIDRWTATSTVGAPEARLGHTAVWTGTRMIIWAGSAFVSVRSGARYDPVADTWSPTSLAGVPDARVGHSAVWTGRRMIVWGGLAPGVTASGGLYDPGLDTWRLMSEAGTIGRASHAAVWTGRSMIVWGGSTSGGIRNTGHRYDPETDLWSPIATTGAPSSRQYAAGFWTGRWLLVWGGEDYVGPLNTGGRYDPAADTWTPTTTLGAPAPIRGVVATWTGDRMVVWGGTLYSIYYQTGARYDPLSDRWAATATSNAPIGRVQHTLSWTAAQMLVWGGTDDRNYMGSGGQYCACAGVTATAYQDADGDGFGDGSVSIDACVPPAGFVTLGGDCADDDTAAWAVPSEARDLLLAGQAMTWSPPATSGGTTLVYDVVRTANARDFLASAICVASDLPATAWQDTANPDTGATFYYLIRPASGCPDGEAPSGFSSGGSPIPTRPCP